MYDELENSLGSRTLGYTSTRTKASHVFGLLSLNKVYADAQGNYTLPDLLNTSDVVESPKLDGAAVACYYVVQGNVATLAQAITRGNGIVGVDVTNHVLIHPNGPIKQLKFSVPEGATVVQVVYEVLTRPDVSDNPRNYAAGALNLVRSEDFYHKELDFVAHGFQHNGKVKSSYSEHMKNLAADGALTVLCSNINEFNWPTDGKVIRLDSERKFEEAGFTSLYPRGAIAIKWRRDGVNTVLRDVVWQVGRTGKVTPVAIFDPIDIEGAVVARASLHNAAFIEALDIDIGDTLSVIRAGEVIPYVLSKVEE